MCGNVELVLTIEINSALIATKTIMRIVNIKVMDVSLSLIDLTNIIIKSSFFVLLSWL